MKANFKKCLKPVLVWEGGYVNHPKDPGGPTNKGITQRVYDAWRINQGKPKQSVQKIVDAEVEAIYKKQYWDLVQGDVLPLGVDLAVFDYAVNSGTGRASRALQKVLGVKQDGQIGQRTLARVEEVQPDVLAVALCEERLRFVKSLRTWSTFGKGWMRRIMGEKSGAQDSDKGIIDIAVRMANEEPIPPLPTKEAGGKADPVDKKLSTEPEAVAAGTGGLSVGGLTFVDSVSTLGEWAGMTKEQVQPFIDYSPYIKAIFFGFLAVSILGGLGVWIKKRQSGALQ
jgi:lysozyme family protein